MTSDRPGAVLFDLLSALLDSWSLWNRVAGSAEAGRRWRHRYLVLTSGVGDYQPYETLVATAAAETGVPAAAAEALFDRWDTVEPWPDVAEVLERLTRQGPIGVVTNCSTALAIRAVARLGVPIDVLVTAEEAGAYKPDPRPYRLAQAKLRLDAGSIGFVAGSPFDLAGAAAVGFPTYWHNRLALPHPAGVPAPRMEAGTLHDLLPALCPTAPGHHQIRS